MLMKPIDWARQFASTMDDLPSLRAFRAYADRLLESDAMVRRELPEAMWAQWDAATGTDAHDNLEAIRLIDARLAELEKTNA